MTRDIIDINDFTILVEVANVDKPTQDSCLFDEPIIAVAFYGSGNVKLSVNYGNKLKEFNHTKGLALSFYADEQVRFIHHVASSRPLQCIVIATATRHLKNLPNQEGDLFGELLHHLVHPKDNYVEGPQFFMTPDMQSIVDQVFKIQYQGKAKMMFFRSQMTALLSHFFGQLSISTEDRFPQAEREKLMQAKQILSDNLDSPPSLTELSKQIGLNTFKLKKNFKGLFGVPVFKYLQNERLTKAHDLIKHQGFNIQEVAWEVGYESLSSFSNAFSKKFGYRPSELKR